IDVATSQKLAEIAEKKDIHFVDAPVSGGVTGAEKATLTFMVGAKTSNDFEKVKEILSVMGKNIVHAGTNGNGLAAKIANNMLLAISMIATAEAMNLGIKLGLDKNVLTKLINSSSGRCWSSEMYNPVPGIMPTGAASNDYNGGFACELMQKDISLALDAANDIKVNIPLGEHASKIYNNLTKCGFAKKDFSVIYKYLNENPKA
ncbi:unnamed protein product, partial [Didymodactylos carnosus]